jgi:exosome complex RNA-binding protein Csl4
MSDRGDIVLGWLTKVVATLAVLGVVGFDLISLGSARFQAEDHAQSAVRAANESYRSSKDLQAAYDAAVAEVVEHGDTIDAQSFTVGPDGRITLTLRRTAATIIVEKVAPLRDWAQVESTVSARPAS